jgi:hypothetical protein
MGLVDPVATGLGTANYPTDIAGNVQSCWNAVSTTSTWWSYRIFKKGQIVPPSCNNHEYAIIHPHIGFDGAGGNVNGTVKGDLKQAAIGVGVPFK